MVASVQEAITQAYKMKYNTEKTEKNGKQD